VSQRTERVQKVAKEVLGEAIQELKDPRVGFVTVMGVRVSPDLRYARVFVTVLGDDEAQKHALDGLTSAGPRLRKSLGAQVRMKYLPELRFELDTVHEQAQRLESLFHRIHEEEAAGGAAAEENEDDE
jgi:ribosome-binding factor A